jgi:hypothetical protein
MSEPNPASGEKMSRQTCYGSIVGSYIPAADSLFSSFLQSIRSQKTGSINDQALRQFLISADAFSHKCSEAMATLLHESSNQREIRETSETVLLRLVRNRCFEGLDTILAEYARLLMILGLDLRQVHGQIGDSRVRDEIAPFAGVKGASAEVSDEIAGRRIGPHKARDLAAIRISDYFNALENLPRELLDYGATKLLGGESDYDQQMGFLFNISDALKEKHDEVSAIVENFDAVKQKRWDEQRATDLAAIKEAARNSLMKSADRRTGFGSLAIGIICGLLDWGAFASGTTNLYVVISAIGVGAIGIFFLYRGIMQLVRI